MDPINLGFVSHLPLCSKQCPGPGAMYPCIGHRSPLPGSFWGWVGWMGLYTPYVIQEFRTRGCFEMRFEQKSAWVIFCHNMQLATLCSCSVLLYICGPTPKAGWRSLLCSEVVKLEFILMLSQFLLFTIIQLYY